ncbi:cytochrome C-552 [Komagataeibacter kakiaceti JCM 25156]|uniref:c-type cytochrome n=1 Tax=Komagataeibacter kakiaceti TaxID=943261 RepID=UPI000471E2DC|nr:cytochrome c [Komagataeibacter kakiaceti]
MKKTLPAVMFCLSFPVAPAGADDGAMLYQSNCGVCHADRAQGRPGRVPPLAGQVGRISTTPEGRQYVVAVALNGMMGRMTEAGETYAGFMPSFRMLPDEQIAAILNHVAGLPDGAETPFYSAQDIAAGRTEKLSPPAVTDRRRALEAPPSSP